MLNPYNKEELEQIKKDTPLMRIGEPTDIAKCV